LISAYPFVDVVDSRAYAAKILGTTLISNIIGYTFYRTRNRGQAEAQITGAGDAPPVRHG